MLNDLRGLVLRHRSVGLAAVGGVLGAGVLGFTLGHHAWQERGALLERQISALQLLRLTDNIDKETHALEESARQLAASEEVRRLFDDGGAAAAKREELDPTHQVDGMLVVDTAQNIRYHSSQAADSTLLKSFPRLGFSAGRLVASRPVAGTPGWVVVSRELSPALMARLSAGMGGLDGQPPERTDLSALSQDARRQIMTRSPAGFAVSTLAVAASGYAVLHDEAGRPAWIFQLRRPLAAVGDAPAHWSTGLVWSLVGGVVALIAALGAGLLLAIRGHFRRQRSVDARYKAIIDQINDGIVIVDSATLRVQYCNPAFLAQLGYTIDEAAALTLGDIFTDAGVPTDSVLGRLRDVDSRLALSMQQRCKSGSVIDVEVRCNTLDVDGRGMLAYVTHDVSVRRKAEQQLIDNQQRLDRMAHHDQLTGLPNRHYLSTFLPQAILDARAANGMLGVVFLDLDRFKHINDTRGHETGDKLLQEVATRLRSCVRDSDVVIRMGGDEFVVVFGDIKSYDEVTQGAARIIAALNEPIVIDRHPLQTTGSVGVSLFPRDGVDMGELLKHSDTAMYQAKERGRNNVQMFSHVMNRKLKHRVAMEASLREALRLKQFEVDYQPFVNLATRKIVGLEALMRWRHPLHGMIPADQFIPVAEETGLIVPMGNFVLHRTLQTMSAWRKAGVALVPVSLNVAPAQLLRGEFQATISTLLRTHDLPPSMLQLEMTERAIFDSSQAKEGEKRQDTLERLRDMGIKIAIDDFGTGYSSLSYLKNWRVDALKIDRSFVRDLVTDSSDLAIVSAIIDIARHLRIQVIAEGIEGYQQAEILRKLGCTVGQGFLFARPMPAEECRVLLGDSADSSEQEEDIFAVFAAGGA